MDNDELKRNARKAADGIKLPNSASRLLDLPMVDISVGYGDRVDLSPYQITYSRAAIMDELQTCKYTDESLARIRKAAEAERRARDAKFRAMMDIRRVSGVVEDWLAFTAQDHRGQTFRWGVRISEVAKCQHAEVINKEGKSRRTLQQLLHWSQLWTHLNAAVAQHEADLWAIIKGDKQ